MNFQPEFNRSIKFKKKMNDTCTLLGKNGYKIRNRCSLKSMRSRLRQACG